MITPERLRGEPGEQPTNARSAVAEHRARMDAEIRDYLLKDEVERESVDSD